MFKHKTCDQTKFKRWPADCGGYLFHNYTSAKIVENSRSLTIRILVFKSIIQKKIKAQTNAQKTIIY